MIYVPSLDSEALRKNIPALAEDRRYSLKDVAEAGGITYRTLRYFLDGERDIRVITASHIAGLFEMTLVGLLHWKPKQEKGK